jgi:uncharacterized protein YjbI with pentapeptide repeats
MHRETLQNAILKPAKQVSLNLEPELIAQMLTDVEGSPGDLPLLQYTLTELWKHRTDNCLQLKTYTQLGGVMGTLQKRATQVYDSFSPEQQAAAQHIFLSLTQLGEGTEDTRRRVLKQDLISPRFPEALIDTIVQRLADEKLIVTSEQVEKGGSNREAVIDVAHEALIRHWLLLRKWLTENRDQLRQKRKIEERAEEWRSHRKSKDYLLQGKPLADAKAFHKQQANTLSLSGLAVEFIQRSSRQKRVNQLRAAGFLTVPALVVFVAIVPHLRQANYDRAWTTIRTRGVGTREALEVLTEGCRERQLLPWIPDYLSTFLWGDCADLRGADLRGADLRDADLRGANLNGVNLYSANLHRGNLSFANLHSINLRDTNLSSAVLRDTNLNDADLVSANLILANLSNADLSNADLRNANLASANLASANLASANLISANLGFSSIAFSDLNDAAGGVFGGANLIRANLIRANLSDANLIGVENLTPEQVRAARNWEEAIYDEEFRRQLLGLEEE